MERGNEVKTKSEEIEIRAALLQAANIIGPLLHLGWPIGTETASGECARLPYGEARGIAVRWKGTRGAVSSIPPCQVFLFN